MGCMVDSIIADVGDTAGCMGCMVKRVLVVLVVSGEIGGLTGDAAAAVGSDVAGVAGVVIAADDDSVARQSANGSSTVCIDLDTEYLRFANFLAHFVQKAGLTKELGIILLPAICANVDLKRATNLTSRYSSASFATRCL